MMKIFNFIKRLFTKHKSDEDTRSLIDKLSLMDKQFLRLYPENFPLKVFLNTYHEIVTINEVDDKTFIDLNFDVLITMTQNKLIVNKIENAPPYCQLTIKGYWIRYLMDGKKC